MQSKFIGHRTREERTEYRENSRNKQKVPLGFLAEYWSVHMCEETSRDESYNVSENYTDVLGS